MKGTPFYLKRIDMNRLIHGLNSKFIFVIILILLPISAAATPGDAIVWQEYDKGILSAKEYNKKILLYFHADWCKYCKLLEKTTFTDKRIIQYLNDNFINISVNSDQNRKLSKKYNIRGVPALFFLTPNSDKIRNIPGYVDSDVFIKMVKFIQTDSYKNMSFAEYSKKK